jgi:hypothetical protein
VILADCDDDGETGASSRMLHLMDVNIENKEIKKNFSIKFLDCRCKKCVSSYFKMVLWNSFT